MNVKPLHQLLLLALTTITFSCSGNKEKQEEIKALKTKVARIEKENTALKSLLTSYEGLTLDTKPYIPKKQQTIKKPSNDHLNSVRYKLVRQDDILNTFNVSKNEIYLRIPITTDQLKIKGVENISSKTTNAIAVFLGGDNGKKTKLSPTTNLIDAVLEIDKLNLDKTLLKDQKKLRVIVFHDNRPIGLFTKPFKECIKNIGYDTSKNCAAYTEPFSFSKNNTSNKGHFYKPNEHGGDIIIGG